MRLAMTKHELPADRRFRGVKAGERPALATLLLDAYRGTVDDEGESEEEGEISQVIHGACGPLLEECSFVAEDEGRLVGATLVTLSGAQALLRHVVVDPSMKRRGIGSFLITASNNALLAAGYRELDLFDTDTNEAVVALYIKLGVRVLERLREPPAATSCRSRGARGSYGSQHREGRRELFLLFRFEVSVYALGT
jgi:GNAT superfamily N-acetyltransferase